MSLLEGYPLQSYLETALSCLACHGLDKSKASRTGNGLRYGWSSGFWQWKIKREELIAASNKNCQFCCSLNDILEEYQTDVISSDTLVSDTEIEIAVPMESDGHVYVIFSWTEKTANNSIWSSVDFQMTLPKICSIPPFKSVNQGGLIEQDLQADSGCREQVLTWLTECINNNSGMCCHIPVVNNPEEMPSRLINIGRQASSPIFLQELPEVATPYIALSHCWGRNFIPTTTKITYDERRQKISWVELTKTFQDAIAISRLLGIGHIWIDSLCIIQDDLDDWNSESSKMGTIYRGAILVLSAASAVDGNGGLFAERYGSFPVRNRRRQWAEEPSHVLFGKPLSHRNLWVHPAQEAQWPLFMRGWTLQERLLATRVVHFTPTEMIWECNEAIRCECQLLDRTNTPRSRSRNLKLNYNACLSGDSVTATDCIESWCRVVCMYSGRLLTKDVDMLPAISGIAKQMYRPEMGDYLAGLWSTYLSAMLLWRADDDDFSRRAHRRPTFYTAPSWSWASVVGAITFEFSTSLPQQGKPVEILNSQYVPSTDDRFGKVSAGQITVSSPTSKARVKISNDKEPTLEIPIMPHDSFATLTLDIDKCEGSYEVSDNEDVECLFFQEIPLEMSENGLPGIVVRRSEKVENAFERVGIVSVMSRDIAPELPELKRGVFTLV